jgi:uncharacterized protein (DUF1684 family)
MIRRAVAALAAAFTISVASSCRYEPAAPPAEPMSIDEYVASVEKWRAGHEASYRKNYSTIAGLHPLAEGANPAGSAPGNAVVLPPSTPPAVGRFMLADRRVRFEPAPNVEVRKGGEPVTQPIELQDDTTPAPDELFVGDVSLVVHPSGDTISIRVRDPNGPLATGFLGFRWFPIDRGHLVTGRFIKDAEPRRLKVLNTYGDVDEFATEGVVEFTWQGQTLRLRPFTTRPGRLYFVFRDASSGQETYEAARFLYADLQADGTVQLDFNQAYNPPCAFNPYTTCPIPLPENRLPVKVLAGERNYPVKVALPAAPR